MAKQLVKIWKQRKKTFERFFNTFSQWYENKEKTQILFFGIKILNNCQNTTIFTQLAERPATSKETLTPSALLENFQNL